MIKINEDFEFERDTYGWQLHQYRDGMNKKTGEPTRTKSTTYHASIYQICAAVIDRSAGGCKSMEDLRQLLNDAEKGLTEKMEGKAV